MEQIENSQNKANGSLLTNIDGLIDYIIDLFKGVTSNGIKILSGFNLDVVSVALKQYFRLTPAKTVIEKFIAKSFPFWDKIFAGDESFFLDNAFTVFSDVPDGDKYIASIADLFRRRKFNGPLDNVGQILNKEELEEYLRVPKEKRQSTFSNRGYKYGESHIGDEDKEEILKFFKAFIADFLKYIHYARRPYQIIEPATTSEGGKVYTFYAVKEFPQVDIIFYQDLLKKDYPINLNYFPVSSTQYLEILKSGTIRTLETPIAQGGGLSVAWAKMLPSEKLKSLNISLNQTNTALIFNGEEVERATIPPLIHQEIGSILAERRLEITKQYAVITQLDK